jgi:putative flippase GtrA
MGRIWNTWPIFKAWPVLLGTLLVMAVIWVNGRPSVFTDTDDYYDQGRTVVRDLSAHFIKPAPLTDPDDIAEAAEKKADERFALTSMGARSAYYGVFLYVGTVLGSLWLVAAIQALLAVWPMWRLSQAVAPKAKPWTFGLVCAGVAAGTALPMFAGFAMPDVFAGIAILCAALILIYRHTLRRREQALIWALMAVCLSFHGSHTMTALCLAVLAAILMLLLKAPLRETVFRSSLIVAAVIVGFAANALYAQSIKAKWGEDLRRPPFLTARVLADGPGRSYLRDACRSGTPYVLCRFRHQMLDESDHILWSDAAGIGVFNRLSYDDRVALEKEEFRFAIGTVLHDPLGQFAASMQNWWWQLNLIYVEDPLRNPYVYLNDGYWGETNLPLLIPDAAYCKQDRANCRFRLRMDPLRAWHTSVIFLALGFLAWRLVRGEAATALRQKQLVFDNEVMKATAALSLLLAGFIINAAVCGILSGPFPRYQARVAWLIPLAAGLVAQRLARPTPKETWQVMVQYGQAQFLALIAWLRQWPLLDAVFKRIDPAFIRFCVVGGIGFVVDAGVLYGLVGLGHLEPVPARFGSFVIAMSTTWALNRLWTFRSAQGHAHPAKQAGLYFLVQITGGAVNIATYSAALAVFPGLVNWLFIPLAMGTALGLVINFLGSKHIAFSKPKREVTSHRIVK